NLLGKTVFEGCPANTINEYIFTPDISGIYFIKAITTEGKIITKRLIKS
ncbi:MAG: T9SS type A sorting domain-containing protein, partial [Bacteroidota bacterium]